MKRTGWRQGLVLLQLLWLQALGVEAASIERFELTGQGVLGLPEDRAEFPLQVYLQFDRDAETGVLSDANPLLESSAATLPLMGGLLPVVAEIQPHSNGETSGYWQNGRISITLPLRLTMERMTTNLFGLSITVGGGVACQARSRSWVNLEAQGYFTQFGGTVAGAFELAEFGHRCGPLTPLLNRVLQGSSYLYLTFDPAY